VLIDVLLPYANRRAAIVLIRVCAIVALGIATARPLVASAQGENTSPLYTALAARLDPDASRPVPRLPRVSVDRLRHTKRE
jgi:hypothetical protein